MFLSLQHIDINVIKKGAAQPFVSNGDIKQCKLLWPGKRAALAFSAFIGILREKQDNMAQESTVLADFRDTLLPKLISGELRVPDAEKLLEDAL